MNATAMEKPSWEYDLITSMTETFPCEQITTIQLQWEEGEEMGRRWEEWGIGKSSRGDRVRFR